MGFLNSGNNNGNTNTENNGTVIVPEEKTLSDYKGGIRYLNLSEEKSDDITFVSTVQPRVREDFSSIDNAVAELDFDPATTTIAEAAEQIVSVAATDLQKVRAIWAWVSLHVDYDHNYSHTTAEEAFTDRLATCDGYSKLVKELCKAVGITCNWVAGVAVRTPEERELILTPGGGENYHAWNRVVLASDRYVLLEATWGASGTVSTGKVLNDKWFDTDPCYFMFSHFIWSGESEMLVSPSIDANVMVKLPWLDPSLEKLGLDGKELVEFLYSHPKASLPDFSDIADDYSLPNLLVVPMSDTLYYGSLYQLTYENDGNKVTKTIVPNSEDGVFLENLTDDFSIYYKYAFPSDNQSSTEEKEEFEPLAYKYIIYDDKAESKYELDNTEINGWRVSVEYDAGTIFKFYDGNAAKPSAVYDSGHQQWEFVSGHHDSEGYGTTYSGTKHFDEDLSQIAARLFSKIDNSIPLDRTGTNWFYQDYDAVYVPLSNKEEFIDSIENYNWQNDKDFADFVNWMTERGVSEEDIDFYKTMASYSSQRGAVITEDMIVESNVNFRKAGADAYPYEFKDSAYYGPGGCYSVGGMQRFFELRKIETRNLFANKTIPVLLVHIKDSEGSASDIVPVDFERTRLTIENLLDTCGLKNDFEVYNAEISMPYSDYVQKYKDENSCGCWDTYDDGWEDIIAEVAKKDANLAAKFSDKNKSAIIKYFDTRDMNEAAGSWCAYNRVMLWALMDDLGYSRGDHIRLYGSAMKDHSPACYDKNCVRDNAICPLCLYTFGTLYE